MADEADQAEAFEAQHRARSLKAHKARLRKSAPVEVDGKRLCVDCGDVILPGRVAAYPDVIRCIDCQADLEKREKQYAKS